MTTLRFFEIVYSHQAIRLTTTNPGDRETELQLVELLRRIDFEFKYADWMGFRFKGILAIPAQEGYSLKLVALDIAALFRKCGYVGTTEDLVAYEKRKGSEKLAIKIVYGDGYFKIVPSPPYLCRSMAEILAEALNRPGMEVDSSSGIKAPYQLPMTVNVFPGWDPRAEAILFAKLFPSTEYVVETVADTTYQQYIARANSGGTQSSGEGRDFIPSV